MRNVFVSNGRAASVGTYAFGFSWGAWAALFISTVIFCLGTRKRKDPVTARPARTGWPWVRRRKSSAANGAPYEGRRVKEEYV